MHYYQIKKFLYPPSFKNSTKKKINNVKSPKEPRLKSKISHIFESQFLKLN